MTPALMQERLLPVKKNKLDKKFICDFHVHSRYSRATSKSLIPFELNKWALLKGIKVIGTGDFTHPAWCKELKEQLVPAEDGLFKLRHEYKNNWDTFKPVSIRLQERCPDFQPVPTFDFSKPRFLLTTEISNIYKKDGKIRKVHNIIFAPDFKTVEKIQARLVKLGANITSNGRPILGLDSKDLLEMMLEISNKIFFVPAHIWTPWFSVLGSRSGFDSIEECFGSLHSHIYAVETGLSTDPAMNWMCSFLDKYTLISNSDAHSPDRLGRNANIFCTELSYEAILSAIKKADPNEFLGTIDLFPQEGKYYHDGHRRCGVSWDPAQTLRNKEICPVCGGKVTVGVMNRVVRLSDRTDLNKRKNRLAFYSIIPLKEILSEISGLSPNSKKVDNLYFSLLEKAGPELNILLNLSIEDIKIKGGELVAEAIKRMREKNVIIKEGFDGEYGRIKVFKEGYGYYREKKDKDKTENKTA